VKVPVTKHMIVPFAVAADEWRALAALDVTPRTNDAISVAPARRTAMDW